MGSSVSIGGGAGSRPFRKKVAETSTCATAEVDASACSTPKEGPPPSSLSELEFMLYTVLQDPTLLGAFRNYLAQVHLAEPLILFWLEVEVLFRCCSRHGIASSPDDAKESESPSNLKILSTAASWKPCDFGCRPVEANSILSAAGRIWSKYVNTYAYYSISRWVDSDTRSEAGAKLGVTKVGDRPKRGASIHEAFKECQKKAFNAMLYDYMPGFIGSDYMRMARDGALSPEQFRSLKHHLRGASETQLTALNRRTLPLPPEPIEQIDLLNEFMDDSCCSVYLRSFLFSDSGKNSIMASKVPPETTDCLWEIRDFWSTKEESLRLARAEALIERYGGGSELADENLVRLRMELVEKEASKSYSQSKSFDQPISVSFRRLTARLFGSTLSRFLSSQTFARLEEVVCVLRQGGSLDRKLDPKVTPTNAPPFSSESLSSWDASLNEKVHFLETTAAKLIPRLMLGKHLRKVVSSTRSGGCDTQAVVLPGQIGSLARASSKLYAAPSSVEEILNDAYGRTLFRRFCNRNMLSESISFLMEVRHFKNDCHLAPPDGTAIYVQDIQDSMKSLQNLRNVRAKHIAEKYISSSARYPINISSEMRDSVLKSLSDHLSGKVGPDNSILNLYDKLTEELSSLLTSNLWRRFTQSPEWKALLNSLENRAQRHAISDFKPRSLRRIAKTVSALLKIQGADSGGGHSGLRVA